MKNVVFQAPTPEFSEELAMRTFAGERGWLDLHSLRETRDAPPLVMRYVDRWDEALRAWEAAAPERPLEQANNRDAIRMFGGPWISSEIVVTLDGFRLRPVEAYIESFEEGMPDADLRRRASAIYEWMERSEAIARDLFVAFRPQEE